MNQRIFQHTVFWLMVLLFLTVYFGRPNGDYMKAFYFGTFLLPVAMATSYFFNYFLVPRYLLRKRYWHFGLYFTYTLIISLYLEMAIVIISFILFAQYQFGQMLPFTGDITVMAITLYFIVFIVAFIRLVRSVQKIRSEQQELTERIEANQNLTLTVQSDRKKIPVPLADIYYIESLADYVKIFANGQIIVTREKISHLESKLPDKFIRSHRSFIINSDHVEHFNKETIGIDGKSVPISRSRRQKVVKQLSS